MVIDAVPADDWTAGFPYVDLTHPRTTEVFLDKIQINPEIDDRLFSVATLDLERELPHSD